MLICSIGLVYIHLLYVNRPWTTKGRQTDSQKDCLNTCITSTSKQKHVTTINAPSIRHSELATYAVVYEYFESAIANTKILQRDLKLCDSQKLQQTTILMLLIARQHELGFRRNTAVILPTSLPELPIQLRDIRNKQKSWRTYYTQDKNLEFGTCVSISRPLVPVLGRKIHVESDFWVHLCYFWAPVLKI